ncbi:MAG: hypothetical protein LIO58_00005, partial [Oscillospiraceae bacterium]|nr:hypothetical protein [Oscillospiraceae bacterium]
WEAGRVLAGCKSRSDFAERAINFYAGYLSAHAHTDYFAEAVSSVVDGMISCTETRLARLQFKFAVEQAKLAHVLAGITDVDDDTLHRLHIKCVDEVKRINGVIKFEDAFHYQTGQP